MTLPGWVVCVVPALLSAIVLAWLGPREQLGYDSFWHVLVARQQDWARFWFEVSDNAHPPLFYLVLKAVVPLGHTVLVYRIPSIVATIVATAVVCVIARLVVADRWLRVVAGLAFGLSYGAITLGLEVRPYALATCLTLAGLYWFLHLAGSGFGAPSFKARGLFALFTTLALLTHYSVAFVAVAAAVSPLVLAVADRTRRAWLARGWITAWPANVLTFGAPIAVFSLFYVQHARFWTGRLQHVPEFLFDPTREGLLAFAARAISAEVNVLLTVTLPGLVALIAAVTLGAGALVLLAAGGARSDTGPRTKAILVPLMLGIMMTMTLIAALAGRYPFGGPLRHQFFLFPFVILSVMIMLDRIAAWLPSGWMHRAFVSVAGGACLASTVAWMPTFSLTPGLPFVREMAVFRTLFPAPPAIYVAQYSLIPFFVHYHDWEWRLERSGKAHPGFGVWKVSKDGQEFRVCRDLAHWTLDFSEADLYSNIERCLKATSAPRVAIFELGRPAPVPNATELIDGRAVNAGLRLLSVTRAPEGLFAGFEQHQPVQPAGLGNQR